MRLRTNTIAALLSLLCAQGLLAACGDDPEADGTGFVVIAKARGFNIAAISQVQVRFEATGDDRFGDGSGEEAGLEYRSEDDGEVFTATGDRNWVTQNYALRSNEFQFTIPFVNPSVGGDVNLQVVIDREIDGSLVRVGESSTTAEILPTEPGDELEVVVGCVADAPCGASEDPPTED